MRYLATPEGGTRSTFEHDAAGQSETTTDTGRFAAGDVTLTLLAPDWNVVSAEDEAWRARLSDRVLLAP